MDLYISGSLAYDRIMNFDGRFSDHILPEKIHVLNVCFNVNGLSEKLGGTAGNIAYGLAQLNESPVILGCLGKDGRRYLEWLERQNIVRDHIHLVEDEYTAGAFITTDQADNQITGFNPGAMNYSCPFELAAADPAQGILIVAPGNLEDMTKYPEQARRIGMPFIFDPGQSLNIWNGPGLIEAMQGARVLISNDYEWEMIMRMTGLTLDQILERVQAVITTRSEKGSILRENGGELVLPAVPATEVKDPTGAGDAYRAGLIKGMRQGLDLPQAALMGATLASFAVARYGTQEYSVTAGEFEARHQAARRQMGWD